MAISKILYMKDCGGHFHGKHLKQALDYVMNPEKTQNGRLIGGMNCQPETAFKQMMDTKKEFGKVDKRQGYHLILSFKEGEVSPDTAYEITQKFVKEYLGSLYEAVYCIHDNKVAENVWNEYQMHNRDGKIGCQLIFSDIGTPGPDKDFTVYQYLKDALVQYGIPEEEIAFIHDAKTDAQRDVLFKEMRTGKKKVLIGSTDKCGTGVNVQTHLVALHHVDCPWKPSSIEQREGRGIRQGNENEEIAVYRYVTKSTFDAYNWSLVENKQRFISQVTTSKAVSRTCEDIDEATLSYAEIKAVATGNPLIKEKMEIDNDVQRLKLLKSSYDNQRYALQDNFMIRYPKLIKAASEKLACVREDIKVRDRELIENPDFAITVGKFTYTERADGGAVMLEAVSKCKTGETTALGSFHGFDLLVEKNFMGTNYLILRGRTEYKVELSTSPVGNMVKLENCFNGIHENEEYLLKKIEQYENDLVASKEEYEKPFAHEEELKEKLSRQFELNALLDLENEKVADADLGGMEEEKSLNVAENEVPYQTRQDKFR